MGDGSDLIVGLMTGAPGPELNNTVLADTEAAMGLFLEAESQQWALLSFQQRRDSMRAAHSFATVPT